MRRTTSILLFPLLLAATGCGSASTKSDGTTAGSGGAMSTSGAPNSAGGGGTTSGGAGGSTQGGSGIEACRPAPPPIMTGRIIRVSTSGSDQNGDGSEASPFASIVRGAKAASPGDVVEVAPGTYARDGWDGHLLQGIHGTAEKPIIVRGKPGAARPVIAPSNQFGGTVIIDNSSHLVFEGFDVTNPGGIVLQIAEFSGESSHVTIRNCRLHEGQGAAIWAGGDNITVEGNEVFDTARSGTTSCISTEIPQNRGYSSHFTVRGNHVYNCGGECIDNLFVEYAYTADNLIHDCKSAGIYNDHARHVVVERNFLYFANPAYASPGRLGGRAMGIQLSSEPYQGTPEGKLHDIVIANNVILNWSWGVSFWNSGNNTADNTFHDVVIAHNLIYGAVDAPLHFENPPAGAPFGIVIANNIIYPGGADNLIAPTQGFQFASNNWVKSVPNFATGQGNVAAEPRLVGTPGSLVVDDYRLAADSLMRGAGAPVPAVKQDYWCKARSATAPTIGIYEP